MLTLLLPSLACLAAPAQLHLGPGVFTVDKALVFLPETTAPAQATAGTPPPGCVLPDVPTWKMLASDRAFVAAAGPELLADAPPLRWQANARDPNDLTTRHAQQQPFKLAAGGRRMLVAQRLDDPQAPPLPAQPWYRCVQRTWPRGQPMGVQVPKLVLYPRPTAQLIQELPAMALTRVQELAKRSGWSYVQGALGGAAEGAVVRGWARSLLLDPVVGDSATLHAQGLQALRLGDAVRATGLLSEAATLSPRAYTLLGDLQTAYDRNAQPDEVAALADQRAALYHELAEGDLAENADPPVQAGTWDALEALARETRALGPGDKPLCALVSHTLTAADAIKSGLSNECSHIQWQELTALTPTLSFRCDEIITVGVSWEALAGSAAAKSAMATGLRAAKSFLGQDNLPVYMQLVTDYSACHQPNETLVPLQGLAAAWPGMPACLQGILRQPVRAALHRMGDETCYCDSAPVVSKAVAKLLPALRSLPAEWDGNALAASLEGTLTQSTTRFECRPQSWLSTGPGEKVCSSWGGGCGRARRICD